MVGKFETEIRERVADLRRARMALWNDSHADAPVYTLGEMVWYRHPAERSAALRPDWLGPHGVRGREGESSYRGSLEHNVVDEAVPGTGFWRKASATVV